jgi:hypothetical protein
MLEEQLEQLNEPPEVISIPPNKKEWNSSQEDLLRDWAEVAGSYRWLHYKAHMWFKRRNLRYMIPLIIMSTVTGTANFAQGTFPKSFNYVPEIIGGINLIAAVLTTLYQLLKISELMESHRLTSINFGKFSRNLRVELTLPDKDRSSGGKDLIKLSRNEIDRLIEQSPTIPRHILASYEKRFEKLNLAKPEIIIINKVETYRHIQNRIIKNTKGTNTGSLSIDSDDFSDSTNTTNNSTITTRTKSFNNIVKNNLYNVFKNITNYISGIDYNLEKENSKSKVIKTDQSPRKKVDYYEEEEIPQLPVFVDYKEVLSHENSIIKEPEILPTAEEVLSEVVIKIGEKENSEHGEFHDSVTN